MKITVFEGDIADAPAEAVCTSTNPRLSLMMGTGAAIRERGGFEVLRACEAIVASSPRAALPPGSAHPTTAGRLPFRTAIHCVASDSSHLSSVNLIRACVKNALRVADSLGCRTVAMPVFGTGHARVKFDVALNTLRDTLLSAPTHVEHVVIAVNETERAAAARAALR